MPPRLLNVGGGSRALALPRHFAGWTHHLLDIDPKSEPDVCGDARYLEALVEAGSYDAVYCLHNIEHYYPHDVPKVLRGFQYALKPEGFADIRCPDVGAVMRAVVERNLDIEDTLYESHVGPIKVHDVLFGYGAEIASSGNDFYAHKSGFTEKSLVRAILASGFAACFVAKEPFGLMAFAFRAPPSAEQKRSLGL